MIKPFQDALDAGHIEVAPGPDGKPFTLDGVQYYQATQQGINMAMGRFHSFSDALRKHDALKLTDELLTAALDSMYEQLRFALAQFDLDREQAQDNIRWCMQTIERLKQRRAFGLDVQQLYEIASIWFFTEDEDPAIVDSEKNRKKIQAWLNAPNKGELYRFFISAPLGQFVPLQGLVDADSLNSIRNLTQLEALDWTLTLYKSGPAGLTPETTSTIESRRETLYGLDGLIGQLLSSTTPLSPPSSATSSES